jgi:hypothetical protein
LFFTAYPDNISQQYEKNIPIYFLVIPELPVAGTGIARTG